MSDSDAKCYAATPAATLEQRIMDCRIAKTEPEWWAAREIEKLRNALDRILVGCNHLGLLIGCDHPADDADHSEALQHYGAGDQYEIWCCWKTIREASNILEKKNA